MIVKGLKKLVDGLAALCAVLLVRFGLWIVLAYTMAFLFVRLSAGIPFSGAVVPVFYAGLGVATALSGVFAIGLLRRRRASARAVEESENIRMPAKTEKKEKLSGKKSVVQAERASDRNLSEPFMQEHFCAPCESDRTNCADLEEKYFGPVYVTDGAWDRNKRDNRAGECNRPFGNIPNEDNRYTAKDDLSARAWTDRGIHPVHNAPDADGRCVKEDSCPARVATFGQGARLLQRLEGAPVPDERPMIFRSRFDPDIYIYEYSDRLQFFRRSGKKITLVATEFKEISAKR